MIKYYHLTKKVIGVYYDVYNELGNGFLESVYEQSLSLALKQAGLRVRRQVGIPVWFRKHQVGRFEADLIIEDLVIVELKAVKRIVKAHRSQLLNYLRATEMEVGLLFNFGPKPEFERFAFDNARKKIGQTSHAGYVDHSDDS